jgi:hypothetical protein
MIRRLLALAAIAVLAIGMGCSGGASPTIPEKGSQTPEEYFNQFDLSSPVVGSFTYKDLDGNVLASGLLGRNDDGLYIIKNRGTQGIDIDLTVIGLIDAFVTYLNPAGTIPTGPNAGLPYYYIGQTMDYKINLLSHSNQNIGGFNPPFSYFGPAQLQAEMRYGYYDGNGQIQAGDLLPGSPIFQWSGIISPGYSSLMDSFTIVNGTLPGLDVTTVKIEASVFFGIFDFVFFDNIAGIWDPQ